MDTLVKGLPGRSMTRKSQSFGCILPSQRVQRFAPYARVKASSEPRPLDQKPGIELGPANFRSIVLQQFTGGDWIEANVVQAQRIDPASGRQLGLIGSPVSASGPRARRRAARHQRRAPKGSTVSGKKFRRKLARDKGLSDRRMRASTAHVCNPRTGQGRPSDAIISGTPKSRICMLMPPSPT